MLRDILVALFSALLLILAYPASDISFLPLLGIALPLASALCYGASVLASLEVHDINNIQGSGMA